VSPVKYKLGFYIAEDAFLHSHCREDLKSYTELVNVFLFMRTGSFACLGCGNKAGD
jgi:hypothetical protein